MLQPNDRKAELVRKGVTLTAIAEAATPRCSVPHVSQVIAGIHRSARIEQAIAEVIGLPVEDVFPPMPEPRRAQPVG